MARAHPETTLHIAIVQWLKVVAPDLVVHHSPNGEVRDKRTAAKLKAMGVRPGWPDLEIIDRNGRLHFMEIKAPSGRLSEAQQAFRDMCLSVCIPWACVHSIDEARAVLSQWKIATREAA